jgi:hypothetical protein
MWCGVADIPGMPSSTARDEWGAVIFFKMIHEFQRIVPVETPVGYGSLLYVESGGPLSNDIFAVVLEDGGKIRHFRSDQVNVLENPTMDIVGTNFKAPARHSTKQVSGRAPAR